MTEAPSTAPKTADGYIRGSRVATQGPPKSAEFLRKHYAETRSRDSDKD